MNVFVFALVMGASGVAFAQGAVLPGAQPRNAVLMPCVEEASPVLDFSETPLQQPLSDLGRELAGAMNHTIRMDANNRSQVLTAVSRYVTLLSHLNPGIDYRQVEAQIVEALELTNGDVRIAVVLPSLLMVELVSVLTGESILDVVSPIIAPLNPEMAGILHARGFPTVEPHFGEMLRARSDALELARLRIGKYTDEIVKLATGGQGIAFRTAFRRGGLHEVLETTLGSPFNIGILSGRASPFSTNPLMGFGDHGRADAMAAATFRMQMRSDYGDKADQDRKNKTLAAYTMGMISLVTRPQPPTPAAVLVTSVKAGYKAYDAYQDHPLTKAEHVKEEQTAEEMARHESASQAIDDSEAGAVAQAYAPPKADSPDPFEDAGDLDTNPETTAPPTTPDEGDGTREMTSEEKAQADAAAAAAQAAAAAARQEEDDKHEDEMDDIEEDFIEMLILLDDAVGRPMQDPPESMSCGVKVHGECVTSWVGATAVRGSWLGRPTEPEVLGPDFSLNLPKVPEPMPWDLISRYLDIPPNVGVKMCDYGNPRW